MNEIEVAFWSRVRKGPKCWEWTGHRNAAGYGMLFFKFPKFRMRAHRWSYQQSKGNLPKGMVVMHKCDNPACVRPSHLGLGTHSDNIRDCSRKGRHWQAKKTHCPHGHPYSGDNLRLCMVSPTCQNRKCKTCAILYGRRKRREMALRRKGES